MRYALPAALLALAVSAPALATGGILCTPVGGAGPSLSLVIGHGIPSGIAGANLREGENWRSTFRKEDGLTVAQSWIDREHLWLDLVDSNALEHEAQLRARIRPSGGLLATGTLARKGRTWQVRCVED